MLRWVCGAAYCLFDYHSEAKKCIISLNFKSQAKGTSFVISETGLAVCSHHTVEDDIATTKDGNFIKIIAEDIENDICLLQLPGHIKYQKLSLGDSDSLVPGEVLYHYGYALNSLIGNRGYYQGRDEKFLYASTEMMHGQSGGPVLNKDGKVVAVCKGHFYCSEKKIKECAFHSGPSMYVPINVVRKLVSQHFDEVNGEWVLKNK